jgi:hypothetical protein
MSVYAISAPGTITTVVNAENHIEAIVNALATGKLDHRDLRHTTVFGMVTEHEGGRDRRRLTRFSPFDPGDRSRASDKGRAKNLARSSS